MYPRENSSGKTLNRYILEGSNDSKQQKKADKEMETSLQCDSAVSWDEASAIFGCSMCFRMGKRVLPQNTYNEILIH